jgi:integrase
LLMDRDWPIRSIGVYSMLQSSSYGRWHTIHRTGASACRRHRCTNASRQVQGTGRPIAPATIMIYLRVIKDLYRQRAKLIDAPRCDALPMEKTFEAAGVTQANKGWIPYIPDAIAVDILTKALDWVTHHAAPILAARDMWHAEFEASKAAGASKWLSSRRAQTMLRVKGLLGPKGEAIDGARVMHRFVTHLTEACFIVIVGFVGMRVSEILSMEVGCIEHKPIGETGDTQAYIVARMFKTVDDTRGRVERWLAPEPVVRAVQILERLSLPMRKVSGRRDLFLAKDVHGKIVPVTGADIGLRTRKFATYVGVPHHDGKPWPFRPHQFRKTFARFVARRDRSQLMALSDHFKHASIAMTAKGYVGNHFDLKDLIDHEGQVDTARALNCFLTSDRLGGRMGERIVAENAAFRGRAGEQVRRDYIEFVLAETDLRIHTCDYGWCVFQPETARCGGVAAPNEATRCPSTCLSCANFVVDERHRGYWQDRRRRNELLYEKGSALTQAVIDQAIGECNRVLALIGDGNNESKER